MLPDQISLPLSAYSELYDKLIPPTNRLRQIKDLVDFSFVYRALAPCYSHVNGRVAVNPILAFKYLLLKVIFDLSDVDVVDRSRYDLSFKYFLDLSPEADVINPSTLSRFRRQRLKDRFPLELLVGQTVHLAGERGLLADRAVILDATHTLSRYTASSAKMALEGRYRRLLSTLRDSVALTGEGLPVPLPGDSAGETLEEVRARCLALVKLTRSLPVTSSLPRVNERLNVLEETLQDVKRSGVISRDRDARVGHKSRHKSFFGYKTHVAMTKNGIITGVEVTTGEKADGQYLQSLVEQSRRNGVEVETVIADTAYSGRDNIIYTSARGIRLVSRLNPVLDGTRGETGFTYNKDAGTMVCPAGHLATREKFQREKGNKNGRHVYHFDVKRCQECPSRQGCYKEGARKKTFSVTVKSGEHERQKEFQESASFKEQAKFRPRVEAKFAQLKNVLGYDRAESCGLDCMCLQGAMTVFAANVLRILTLTR